MKCSCVATIATTWLSLCCEGAHSSETTNRFVSLFQTGKKLVRGATLRTGFSVETASSASYSKLANALVDQTTGKLKMTHNDTQITKP